ncbi:Site-specific DNA recombinase [Saccharopolyspora shandongensis]|uniref:Site-specific DNA recombinase n=1 Tax=Saccharopolyspora shandongensis TaxID=418495 RepID=A0A1H3QF49_9PSEU|nr:recombinase family protein [Saccharopolyspora shandongensis]SDZ12184.1 Site-specific DNA recombinase [Saccharopolyspora shandongensis]
MARLLGRIRLSRFQGLEDVTTSPERQRLAIEKWADANGHEIVGWAEDLDLGRSVDPLTAPELSKWFTEPERIDAWDIVAAYRLDRLATGSIYLSRVMSWCQDHGKSIVSTSETFDLSSGPGRMVAFILAEVAAGELEAIRERNTNTFDYNYSQGKYKGRMTPYGYKAEGDKYVVDHDAKAVILEAAERIIKLESIRSVLMDLNKRGVPSPRDQNRVNNGKESKGERWSNQSLTRILSSETLLGYTLRREVITGPDGKPIRDAKGQKQFGKEYVVRDEAGAPVVRAEPLMTRTRLEELQEALSKKTKSAPKRRTTETALLLRVLFCSCGEPMYRVFNGSRAYYRCASSNKGTPCGNKAVRLESTDENFLGILMEHYGSHAMQKRVYVPATNNADELASIEAEIENIAEMVMSPAFRGKTKDRMNSRLQALDTRRTELEGQPVQPAGYRMEPTGETFSEHWNGLDADQRNAFLRNAKVQTQWHGDHYRLALGKNSILQLINPGALPMTPMQA